MVVSLRSPVPALRPTQKPPSSIAVRAEVAVMVVCSVAPGLQAPRRFLNISTVHKVGQARAEYMSQKMMSALAKVVKVVVPRFTTMTHLSKNCSIVHKKAFRKKKMVSMNIYQASKSHLMEHAKLMMKKMKRYRNQQQQTKILIHIIGKNFYVYTIIKIEN